MRQVFVQLKDFWKLSKGTTHSMQMQDARNQYLDPKAAITNTDLSQTVVTNNKDRKFNMPYMYA